MTTDWTTWDEERGALLGRKISELGLSIYGSRVERLVDTLYAELQAKGISFRPTVYLSDQWGCPDGTPLIGVPFYLVDPRLEQIEAEMSAGVENDDESMRYMRHECGHALNYAFKLYDRADWRAVFGQFSRPYRERYRADPFSRDYVRHILGWYAQKHPDEDFAETFAVWLTPDRDWRREYAGWPALGKLEYVDCVVREVASVQPAPAVPVEDDLPVEAMRYTVAEHYAASEDRVPIRDERQFDTDLRRIFMSAADAPGGEAAHSFIRRHYREIVSRISYWTSESPSVVRSLVDHLARRGEALELRVGGLEAATLVELTAFGTAVVMNHRYAQTLARPRRGARPETTTE
ncbi:MAG TPA: putative zinc-binding metallopeptidase [Gemmatimonadaceae bacterium]|jgi:putative zinc-binding metallo-peptidase|nr:putative zinc-binding metallopeptidase [Gemmatimonadaceae bacterium]